MNQLFPENDLSSIFDITDEEAILVNNYTILLQAQDAIKKFKRNIKRLKLMN